ncbi:MAG: alpha/beta hydrolase, partial [Promethearchaeota archaeon]
MERNTMDKKRIILISAFLSMFIIGTFLIFTIPTEIKITYGKTVETKDGETISFNVFEPKNGAKRKPAILIGHGIMVNKEMMKELAIELATSGFVAITFDFRGHGQSSGEINRLLLTQDVKAIKKYLETRGDIYIHKLGYIGYSMGGGPGNKIVKDDEDYKCFIGIGTELSIDYDDCVNRTLNILMLLAKYDEGRDLKTAKEEIADRLDIDAAEVKINTLYGSFEDGDATKLFYDDNSDHFLSPYDSSIIREARDWVKSTFPNVYPINNNYYANIRALILMLQLIGGIGFFLLILDPICRISLKNKERENDEKSSGDGSLKKDAIKAIFCSFIFFIPGILILLPFFLFLPLTVAGLVLMLLYGQVLGIFFLLWRESKDRKISLKQLLLDPFKVKQKDVIRDVLVGIFLSLVLFLILYLSIGLNYLGILPSL